MTYEDKHIPESERIEYGFDEDYEIVPSDSPMIKEIKEYNRKLRPELYAQLDKEREQHK